MSKLKLALLALVLMPSGLVAQNLLDEVAETLEKQQMQRLAKQQ